VSVNLDDYVDVAERIALFRSAHPEGSLQPFNPAEPLRVMQIGDQTYLLYVAAAYRHPEDPRPGIGIAWEVFPGRTPYTKNSEAMVAETSAWGRAIVAALAADTKRGIASQEEVRNRRAEREKPDPRAELRAQIAAFAREHDMPLESVADTFQANYRVPIASGSVDMLTAFLAELREDVAQPAEEAS
jgi:hypothetical protein